MISATSMPLTEGAIITVVKNFGGDFGLQRMYANIGMMAMTPIAGINENNSIIFKSINYP